MKKHKKLLIVILSLIFLFLLMNYMTAMSFSPEKCVFYEVDTDRIRDLVFFISNRNIELIKQSPDEYVYVSVIGLIENNHSYSMNWMVYHMKSDNSEHPIWISHSIPESFSLYIPSNSKERCFSAKLIVKRDGRTDEEIKNDIMNNVVFGINGCILLNEEDCNVG